jgi:hypothetical protein
VNRTTLFAVVLLANLQSFGQESSTTLDAKRYISWDLNAGLPDMIFNKVSFEMGINIQPVKKMSLCLRPYFMSTLFNAPTHEIGLMFTSQFNGTKFLFEPGISVNRVTLLQYILGSTCCPVYTELGVSARLGAFWKFHKNFNLGLSSHLNYHPSNWIYSTMIGLRITNGAKHQPKAP